MPDTWSRDRVIAQNEQDYQFLRDPKQANADFFRMMRQAELRAPVPQEAIEEDEVPQPTSNQARPVRPQGSRDRYGSRNNGQGGRQGGSGNGNGNGNGNGRPQHSSGGAQQQARRTHGGQSGESSRA